MLVGLSLFDPLGGIGQDIVGWLGHSISQGIGGFTSWAIGGVIHAMQATTTPDFTSWFKGPWRAMLTVVAWLSVPILFIGVGTAALRGDLTSVLKRGLGAPVVMAIGTAVAIPVTAGVLTLVNACCGLLVNVALGGNQGFGQGLGHLSDFALSATVTTGGSSLPGLAAALIVALAGLAALVIWFVLALRGALLYLEVLAIPLGPLRALLGRDRPLDQAADRPDHRHDPLPAGHHHAHGAGRRRPQQRPAVRVEHRCCRWGHDDAVPLPGLPHPRLAGPPHGPEARPGRDRARGGRGIPDRARRVG